MLLIFDLDGTLIDSAQDLAIATNATRAHLGLSALPASVVNSYVGNGAAVLVRRALPHGITEDRFEEAFAFFLRYYRQHALAHTKLFPGVEEVLRNLHAQGHPLAVLTNKPHRISSDILTALGVGPLFSRVYGGDSFARKKPDPVGILQLQQELGIVSQEKGETDTWMTDTWMIGDSAVDIQTARNAGVRACGVAWGFQPESLTQYPPDVLVHEPAHLESALRARL